MRCAAWLLGLVAFAVGCGGGSTPSNRAEGVGGTGGSGTSGGSDGEGFAGEASDAGAGAGARGGGRATGPCEDGAEDEGTTPCGLNARGTFMRVCKDGKWEDTPYCFDPDECIDDSQEWGGTCSEGRQELKRCKAGTWKKECVEGWTVTMGSPESEVVFAGTVRDDGTSFVVGHTTGELSGENAGYDDAFLMKIDQAGKVAWKRQWGTTAPDAARGVAVDKEGIFVVGYTSSDLGGQDAGGNADAFLRKMTHEGKEVWTKQWGTEFVEAASDVLVAKHGVFVIGRTEGDLGGANQGDSDAWLSKVDAETGFVDWTKQWGSSDYDDAARGAVDSKGDVIVVGSTLGKLGASDNQGLSDAYVRKLKGTDGEPLWTVQFGTAADDGAVDVVVGADDRVIVVGYTGGAMTSAKNKGDLDVFLMELDGADGSVRWVRQFGTKSEDRPGALAISPSGHFYVAGTTSGNLRGVNAGQKDAFLTKFDATGEILWTEQWGSEGRDYALGLGLDAEEGVYVIGYTDGELAGKGAGAFDAFVKRFYPH
jgi:hypothetical protein